MEKSQKSIIKHPIEGKESKELYALIIDENSVSSMLLESILKKMNFNCITAADATVIFFSFFHSFNSFISFILF